MVTCQVVKEMRFELKTLLATNVERPCLPILRRDAARTWVTCDFDDISNITMSFLGTTWK